VAFGKLFYVTQRSAPAPAGVWLALNLRRANIDVFVIGSLPSRRREEPPLQGTGYRGLEDKDMAELMKLHKELN
jgi:hypothetical protein